MTVLIGFTLAAFNLDRIRSFRAKHQLGEEGKPTGDTPRKTRARRRTGKRLTRTRTDDVAGRGSRPTSTRSMTRI
jgi:hypothetical protein